MSADVVKDLRTLRATSPARSPTDRICERAARTIEDMTAKLGDEGALADDLYALADELLGGVWSIPGAAALEARYLKAREQ